MENSQILLLKRSWRSRFPRTFPAQSRSEPPVKGVADTDQETPVLTGKLQPERKGETHRVHTHGKTVPNANQKGKSVRLVEYRLLLLLTEVPPQWQTTEVTLLESTPSSKPVPTTGGATGEKQQPVPCSSGSASQKKRAQNGGGTNTFHTFF